MAENLILRVAVASVVGVFFLALFSVLARRERRAFRKVKVKGANPSQRGWSASDLLACRLRGARLGCHPGRDLILSLAKPEVAPIRLWPAHLRLVGESADKVASRNWCGHGQFVPVLGCATLSDT